jgi:hypothetical protein
LRACLMARVRRRWCVVQTPVRRRGTILPRSATNPCNRRTSRYGMASIFSVQNLQTFLRRKNLPRPPGPPEPPGRPPGRPPGPPGPPDGRSLCAAGALTSGAFTDSSDILFPLYPVGFLGPEPRYRKAVSNSRERVLIRREGGEVLQKLSAGRDGFGSFSNRGRGNRGMSDRCSGGWRFRADLAARAAEGLHFG